MVWGLSLDGWNNLIVAFLVAVGIFGVFGAGATYIAFQLQKQEAINAVNTLAQYQVVASVKIAEAHAAGEAAKADAARANEAAGKANERAAEAELALAKIENPKDNFSTLRRDYDSKVEAVCGNALRPLPIRRSRSRITAKPDQANSRSSRLERQIGARRHGEIAGKQTRYCSDKNDRAVRANR